MPEQQTTILHTQEIENIQGETPSGVPFFNSKGRLVCDLCAGNFTILNPIDFKDIVWKQGKNVEFISENKSIKRCELELCYGCWGRTFANSKVLINFSQRLFDCLKEVKNGSS